MGHSEHILRDLGDGLILRRATPDDVEPLVAFNADVHREPGMEEPDEGIIAWVRDLMTRDHPTFDVGDFTVVEDTNSGAIVSSLCLISQTWAYSDIEFGVGRPELVGTHPDYRRRGLIRAQFEVVHQWSAERGERMQVITGIPYFYRQFGYEMALARGGGRVGYRPNAPKLKDGQEEPYLVRPAMEADLGFIAHVYAEGVKRYPVACARDEAGWRYELDGRSKQNVQRRQIGVVETKEGEPVGFVVHSPRVWRQVMMVSFYELKPGVSWLAVTPSVVRYLWKTGEEYLTRAAQEAQGGDEDKKEPEPLEAFAFWLGEAHPVYQAFGERLPRVREPYAFYVRVPDLPGFLQHVAPVLERRLAESVFVGHTGEIKISFYRDGLRLVFESGKLKASEPWQPTDDDRANAAFSNLTFLQLLFSYRSFDDLHYAFVDCWASEEEAQPILKALFPKQPSHIWPLA